jgi:drug/metabolite transporter (DMT)-like permease
LVSEPDKKTASAPVSALADRLSQFTARIMEPVAGPFRALPGNARGAIWILLASFFFTVMVALIKSVGGEISVFQILLFRQIVMTCTVMPILVSGFPEILKTRHLHLHLVRVALAVVAMTCGFTAFIHLPLAEATAIGFAKSLFVTVLALFILREVAGPRRWIAVLVGFAGVLIMVQPGPAGFNFYSILAVIAAAAAAGVMVIIRKLSRHDRSVTILSYQAIMVGLLMLVPTVYYWVTPTLEQWLIMGAIGLFSVVGQLMNIQGFKEGEASAVAPMDYTRLIYAALIGFAVFGEVPDLDTALGAALIIGTSIYTVRAEKRAGERSRKAEPAGDNSSS